MRSQLYVGTSGWNYKKWAHDFYKNVPQKNWLRFCASHFTAIEVNGTFYRLQPTSTFRKWKVETPPGFYFAIKGHRFVTHNKKLLDPDDPVRRSLEPALALGEKLAAVVWQLSHRFEKNLPRLQEFLRTLDKWDQSRHAIEFRHQSWFNDAS
jgi:uncharacterized protein YecE (DUF72 family)